MSEFLPTLGLRYAVTLTTELLILNICSRSDVTLPNYVPNLSEIDQTAAELFMTYYSVFVGFRGCPKKTGVLKRAWTDLHEIWWEHCPIILTHQVQKEFRYFTPFRNARGSKLSVVER